MTYPPHPTDARQLRQLFAAIGVAIARSLETGGKPYAVVRFLDEVTRLPSGNYYAVALGTKTPYGAHEIATPAYLASLNHEGFISVCNSDVEAPIDQPQARDRRRTGAGVA